MSDNILFFDKTPGSLSRIDDIKILILSILYKFEFPIDQEILNNSLQLNATVNYFNFCQSLSQLLRDNIVNKTSSDKFNNLLNISKNGKEIVESLGKSIPKFMVDRNIKTINELLEDLKQSEGKIIDINKTDDGYVASLVIDDIGTSILDIKLFAPDKNQAIIMKNAFKYKTIDLYRLIIALIHNDYQTILDIAANVKKLKNNPPKF